MNKNDKYFSSQAKMFYVALIFLLNTFIVQPTVSLAASHSAKSPLNIDPEAMLQIGEELEYSVHYSFFNIGTIRLKIIDKTKENGKVIYSASAFMDSNPALSWLVNLHVRFFSKFDREIFSYEWIGEDSTTRDISYQILRFKYDTNTMFYESGKKRGSKTYILTKDTVTVSQKCQDGLSLFYYARAYLHQQQQVTVPTCIENKERRTLINFLNERTKVKIDSVDYPIDCKRFEGTADFTGIFGLTGGFEGWFSNDEAAVPITARLKVILGSVYVELRRWNRNNWMPPRWSN